MLRETGESDDISWAERSEFWRTYEKPKRGGRKKFSYRQPIILAGHGLRLQIHHGTLLIRNGFTHYPQQREQIRFFPGDPNLPDRIIILDGSGGISLDALGWMSDQEIELIRINWRGEVWSVAGKQGYSARPELVAAQRACSSRKGMDIFRWLIREKISASIETLASVFPSSENRDTAILRLRKWLSEINKPGKANSLSQILGIEGVAAAAYFRAWHGIPLKWTGLKRAPIPPAWLEVGARNMSWRKRGTNARHPINAMLNYGYGILKSKLKSEIIGAGFDPTIGVLHSSSRNRTGLVYDLMEPLRPCVDRKVLEFALAQTFTPSDFTINRLGGCRINPQMARALVRELDIPVSETVNSFGQLVA